MAEVRAFRGVTFDPARADLDQLLCPPYDVISPAQQAAYYARSPYNAVRLVLNREPGPARYPAAAAELNAWLASGVLTRAESPCLYIHRQTFSDPLDGQPRQRTGVIAAVRLEPWSSGAVLPHEHTMPGPKQDRLELMRATDADTEPIWVFHPDPVARVRGMLADLTRAEPYLDIEFQPEAESETPVAPERHEIWRVSDRGRVTALEAALSEVQLYIADGHHRYETALFRATEVGGSTAAASRFKVMLISAYEDEGLLVLPTHRLVRLPPAYRLGTLLATLRGWGWSSEQPSTLGGLQARLNEPTADGHLGLGLFAEGRFSYVEGVLPPAAAATLPKSIASLDVALLHHGILEALLGITMEMAGTPTLAFSRDAGEVEARVRAGEFDAAFLLRAPSLVQIREVADEAQNMPQKSTYFWPKPASGLILALQPPGEGL